MKDFNFKIESAKARFFDDKEQYLDFKAQWKRSCDDGLDSTHYMIYNLLRGYEISRGFTPITRPGKLMSTCGYGGAPRPYAACEWTAEAIISAAKDLERINHPSKWSRDWARRAVSKMLAPFDGTFDEGDLYELGKILHAQTGSKYPFPEFTVPYEWKTEEQFERAEFLKELKEPSHKKTLKDKLFAWSKS